MYNLGQATQLRTADYTFSLISYPIWTRTLRLLVVKSNCGALWCDELIFKVYVTCNNRDM